MKVLRMMTIKDKHRMAMDNFQEGLYLKSQYNSYKDSFNKDILDKNSKIRRDLGLKRQIEELIKDFEKKANNKFKKAYELEKEVIQSFKDDINNQPARAILYLSCASIAYHAKEYTESKKLCQEGLEIVSKEVLKDSDYFKNEFEKLLKEIEKNGK